GGVRQHGIDLAGFRGEVVAGDRLAALVARHFFEQALEFGDVTVHRVLEIAVGAIALADLVEGLLTLGRIEPPREGIALAAAVAIPEVADRLMVDHPRDVDRDRIERLDAAPR